MPKRILQGRVVSNAADKTIVVLVEQRIVDKRMGKIIRRSKKYHAHDETNQHKSGELVRIKECAPLSKLKHWVVVDSVAKGAPAPAAEETPAAEQAEQGTAS